MASSSERAKVATEVVIDRFAANEEVWQTIFEMLEVKDRVRLEMTNKRLGMLMFSCWKRVTSFDAECLKAISDNPSKWKNREKRWTVLVAICIDRIGDGLRSLTIREVFLLPVWTASLRSIGQGCPNVETINFVIEDECRTLDILFDSFSRLKTLTVSTTDGHGTSVSAYIFLSISTSIEVIHGLSGIYFENAAEMEGFFAHRPSMREVSLSYLSTRDRSKADIFRVIAERCPYLKSIKLVSDECIDYSGVVALESMKELRIYDAELDEMEIVTICERSPLVEALEFRFPSASNIDLESAALNALGSLTKLADLCLNADYSRRGSMDDAPPQVAPSLVTEFVRDLARNSGSSLRRLHLYDEMSLPTSAIEALANGCGKLRYVFFYVRVGEAEPASIRFLIDCIVAHPSWITQTDQPTLEMKIGVIHDYNDVAGRAAFEALADPAADLSTGVRLEIKSWN